MIQNSQSNFRMQKTSGGCVSGTTFHAARWLSGLWVKVGNYGSQSLEFHILSKSQLSHCLQKSLDLCALEPAGLWERGELDFF